MLNSGISCLKTLYTDVNKKNASLIISDFLAMLYKNEQPRKAYLCKCWTRLENDIYLACRWHFNLMTLYMFNVDMMALFTNRLWFQFEFAPSLCSGRFAKPWTNFGSIFQTVMLASNNFIKFRRHFKDKMLGPFIKLANILVLF